ncbi:hypothetical protein [Nocardioides jensenii]|uniref:hypothetical protein n=1 Tax=Nocardioides jensenii TaxID=1843 RepID=UPI00082EB5FD|nr:hypothetical protein [Nocardioides jensenii]
MIARRRLGWLLTAWQQHAGVATTFSSEPAYADCVATEQLCGLPEGQLSSLVDLVGPAGAPIVRVPAQARTRAEVDVLLGAALDGRATAVQWRQVGALVRERPDAVPYDDRMDALVQQLTGALPRGVKHAFRLMRSAALDIAAVPELSDRMVEGIRFTVEDVDGPALLEPIGLLDEIDTAASHQLILELLDPSRSRIQRSFAAGLATRVLERGAFDADERSRVLLAVLSGWRSDPVEARAVFGQLIEALPPGLSAALARDVRIVTPAPPPGEPADEEDRGARDDAVIGALMPWALMDSAIATDAGDPVVDELRVVLHEALLAPDDEWRWRASLLLSASPFHPGVGDGLLDLISANGTAPALRRRAAELLSHVSCDRHVLRIVQLLDDPDPRVATRVTAAYAHTSLSELADHVLRTGLTDVRLRLARARLYAMGMTGSPGLTWVSRSTTAPRWQRRTAGWWLARGPAIKA